MVRPRHLRMYLKIAIIFISLGIFYKYFFISIATQYSEKLTSWATEDKPFEKDESGFKIPSFILCPQPSVKASVMEKYNISEAFFNLLPGSYEHLAGKVTYEEIITEASFKVGVDFNLYFTSLTNFLASSEGLGTPLSLGNTTRTLYDKTVTIQISELYSTSMTGQCFQLKSNISLSVEDSGYFLVLEQLNSNNILDSLHVTITSDADYMAGTIGIWKALKPIQLLVPFGKGAVYMDLKEHTSELIKNCDNQAQSFFECISKKVTQIETKCPSKCVNRQFKTCYEMMNKKYQYCTNLNDDNCVLMEATSIIQKDARNCQMHCRRTEYLGEAKNSGTKYTKLNHSAEFMLITTQPSRLIHKEYYIYDEVGLVGTLGGSLGLFLGFSFYGLLSDIIDYLIKD